MDLAGMKAAGKLGGKAAVSPEQKALDEANKSFGEFITKHGVSTTADGAPVFASPDQKAQLETLWATGFPDYAAIRKKHHTSLDDSIPVDAAPAGMLTMGQAQAPSLTDLDRAYIQHALQSPYAKRNPDAVAMYQNLLKMGATPAEAAQAVAPQAGSVPMEGIGTGPLDTSGFAPRLTMDPAPAGPPAIPSVQQQVVQSAGPKAFGALRAQALNANDLAKLAALRQRLALEKMALVREIGPLAQAVQSEDAAFSTPDPMQIDPAMRAMNGIYPQRGEMQQRLKALQARFDAIQSNLEAMGEPLPATAGQ
jgi:hypothetical protein